MKNFLTYLIMVIICIAGVFSGLRTYKAITETGKVVGEIEHYDPYINFNKFDYDLTGKLLYENAQTGDYEIIEEYLVSNTDIDFNDCSFDVIVNNKPCYNVKVFERNIFAETELSFLDLYGHELGSISFKINFEYWVNKTVVKISVPRNSNIDRLNMYLDIYGLQIRIIEGQHASYQIDDISDKVGIYYVDAYGHHFNVGYVDPVQNLTVRDVIGYLPTSISCPGFKFVSWSCIPDNSFPNIALRPMTSAQYDMIFDEKYAGCQFCFRPVVEADYNYGIFRNGSLVSSFYDLIINRYIDTISIRDYSYAVSSLSAPNLNSITGDFVLPSGIDYLDLSDLNNNLNLTGITLPRTLKCLYLYGSNFNFTELYIPNSVIEIFDLYCPNLNKVYIPSSVEVMYDCTFNKFVGDVYFEVSNRLPTFDFDSRYDDCVFHYGYSYEQYLAEISNS